MKDFGVLVPIVTPCDADGKIDHTGLKNVCDDMLAAGCAGIFGAGSTGRGPWFRLDDQAQICRTIKDAVKDKAQVFMGCTATGLGQMTENARVQAASGADVAVITAPGYFHYNMEEIEYILTEFAEQSPIPVLIYDIPDFAGVKLGLDMLVRLAAHPNVIGIKDSSADAERFATMLHGIRDREDFLLLQGKELILAESLLNGASGLVVSLLHIDPAPFVGVYNACRAGDAARAYKLQEGIAQVFHALTDCTAARPEISTLFYILNHALRRRGVCDNILMPYERDFPDWLPEKAERAYQICSSILA